MSRRHRRGRSRWRPKGQRPGHGTWNIDTESDREAGAHFQSGNLALRHLGHRVVAQQAWLSTDLVIHRCVERGRLAHMTTCRAFPAAGGPTAIMVFPMMFAVIAAAYERRNSDRIPFQRI